jgi:hypothetical protein
MQLIKGVRKKEFLQCSEESQLIVMFIKLDLFQVSKNLEFLSNQTTKLISESKGISMNNKILSF